MKGSIKWILIPSGVVMLILSATLLPIPDGCVESASYAGDPEDGFTPDGSPVGDWLTILPTGNFYVLHATARGGYKFSDGTYRKFEISSGGRVFPNTDAYVWEAGLICVTYPSALRRMWRLRMGIDYPPHGLYNPDELSPLHEWFTYN